MPSSRIYEVFKLTRYGMLFEVACLFLAHLICDWPLALVIILSFLIFWTRSQCAYISNSYSAFCTYSLFQIFFLILFIPGSYILSPAPQKEGWPTGTLLIGVLLAITAISYLLISRLNITPVPYEIRDGRVHVAPRREAYVPPVWAAMGTLGGGAVVSLMDEYPTVTLMVCMALPTIVMIGIWRTVAGLAHLRAEERRKGVRYTFSNLEEIQAIRARSWAARLFIALNNAIGIRLR
ncbi:hypothetical protein ODI84_05785 [Pseudomonas putida]|uniref:Uncharacterized protein n=1 Tax=Pseudomonas putida TaxID=303 RepID=A0A1X0ZUI9_PSEPU|nr:hypothetical protein [Pseudomonas putida]EAN8120822.1 hypothetical protein [Salmonella enterica]MEB3899696.1 hypothetical protein [Pseudomonas putida]ORL63395.1 hypothetical protein B7H17_15300 [Pseudomonas putida]